MKSGKSASIMDSFEALEDPRIDRCKRHQLLDIIVIAICATICGADSWVHMEMFGRSKEEWLKTFLKLPTASRPTTPPFPRGQALWRRILPAGPGAVPGLLHRLDSSDGPLLPGEVVAIDGKTVRRSYDRTSGKQAIHLVSAWASANTMTLGQVKTGEKSNEITAIPQLLQMLDLQGCIVTIDAMGCQKDIAQGILDGGADYVLALKENQGRLYGDVRDLFEGAEEFGFEGVPHDYATTLNKGHGRLERRECRGHFRP